MTTCAYTPGVGKISETDVNGTTTYYDYNKFGLLKTVTRRRRYRRQTVHL